MAYADPTGHSKAGDERFAQAVQDQIAVWSDKWFDAQKQIMQLQWVYKDTQQKYDSLRNLQSYYEAEADAIRAHYDTIIAQDNYSIMTNTPINLGPDYSWMKQGFSYAADLLMAVETAGVAYEVKTVTSGSFKLYRAVTSEEANSLTNTGAFSSANGSMDFKFFASNYKDAVSWGNRMNGEGKFKVVEFTFAGDEANFMYWSRLDNIGAAYGADIDYLNTLNFTMKVK